MENALYKRALGYDYEVIRTEHREGAPDKVITTTRHVVGDTTAQIFWLKNRKPEKWKTKDNIEVEQYKETHIYIPELDPESE